MKKLLKNDLLAIVLLGPISGLFAALSFEPFNFPLVGWLMPWPLFYFAGRFRNDIGKLLFSGFTCSFFFSVFTFYWMYSLFGIFGGMGKVVSLLMFVPFGLFFNMQFLVFVLLFGISQRYPFKRYFRPAWLTAGP